LLLRCWRFPNILRHLFDQLSKRFRDISLLLMPPVRLRHMTRSKGALAEGNSKSFSCSKMRNWVDGVHECLQLKLRHQLV
jgi:hypothetical protein